VAAPLVKAGGLDDPIWLTVPTASEVRRGDSHRRWWPFVLVGLIAFASIGLVFAPAALGSGHPGGDPGGVIAAEVRNAANEAVPPGSQIVGHQVNDSLFGDCGYSSPASGWSTVTGGVAFRTSFADTQVLAATAARLRSDGWTEISDAIWTKTFESGSAAELRLIKGYLVPDGWTAWIDAEPKGPNCGGPSTL
jgi:hypothetical protein